MIRDCFGILAPGGWDINVLVGTGSLPNEAGPIRNTFFDQYTESCATKSCTGTVQVDGKCYYAHQVNYILLGKASAFCISFLARIAMPLLVRFHKLLTGRLTSEGDDAVAWFWAGYGDWPKMPSPSEQVSHCSKCDVSLASEPPFCWQLGLLEFDEGCLQ
jgi:hypothetical protein